MKQTSIFSPAPILAMAVLAFPWGARAAEAPSVSFRAVCFHPQGSENPEFFVTRDGARMPLEVDKSRLSGPQEATVRDGQFVDFHISREAKPGDLPPVTLTLPTGSRDHLLFVFSPSGSGYRAWPVTLPLADFKAGATLMINAAPVEIAARTGEAATPVMVQPGSCNILPIPDGFKDPMMPVQIFGRRDQSEQWQISQSTRWAVDLRFRSYLFFYRNSNSEQLQLHGFTEPVDSPASKE